MGRAFDKIAAALREVRAALAEGHIASASLSYPKVTRLVLVDHSATGNGLVLDHWGVKDVMVSIQDEGRTLKVFVR